MSLRPKCGDALGCLKSVSLRPIRDILPTAQMTIPGVLTTLRLLFAFGGVEKRYGDFARTMRLPR